jgi:His-Xaa-Ser system radical SAM maturase HxsB
MLLVNECGDFYFLSNQQFAQLLGDLSGIDEGVLFDLESRHFIAHPQALASAIDLTATKYRSRKQFMSDFTALHMLVVTLRCNHKCEYCQVSSEEDDAYLFDMKPDTARQIVDYIFQTPSPHVKIEFQGGEPLLNWDTIVETVVYAESKNASAGKDLSFVICTNLIALDEKHLEFIKQHKIDLSTSLDGQKWLHDKHRLMRNDRSSYDIFLEKLALARSVLGQDSVAALMTVTVDSLNHFEQIVDEYIKQGFTGVFFRSLNPYGDASKNEIELGYSMREFTDAYKKALDYIIQKNLDGVYFLEFFSTLLMSRILTPFSTGFVDLQSPAGTGISGVIYDYNGDIFPADEGRMLARMGDAKFRMGNVFSNSYQEIFQGAVMQELVSKSCVECLPACSSCAYRSYCGADPIRNYLETGDVVGKRARSPFCERQLVIFDFLFDKIRRAEKDDLDVFWSWIIKASLKDMKNENA